MNEEVLHIGMSEKGGARVLRLTGQLDSYTSDRLTGIARTWATGAKKVVVNLDGLEYIDSSGLAALVGMWVRARDSHASFVITCRSPRIRRIMEITGLLNLFSFEEMDTKLAEVAPSAVSPATKFVSVGKTAA